MILKGIMGSVSTLLFDWKSRFSTWQKKKLWILCSPVPMISPCIVKDLYLKGHCHGILASFYNAEICSCINENPKIMMQFCYLGLYDYTETIYCRLALNMARMEMYWNLKKLASFFQILEPFHENIARNSLWFALAEPPFIWYVSFSPFEHFGNE